MATGADSVLASLTQEQFDAGLHRLRDHATKHPSTPVTETIDYFAFRENEAPHATGHYFRVVAKVFRQSGRGAEILRRVWGNRFGERS
jgi:hypothetical protein